jgi:hypothetical protein
VDIVSSGEIERVDAPVIGFAPAPLEPVCILDSRPAASDAGGRRSGGAILQRFSK